MRVHEPDAERHLGSPEGSCAELQAEDRSEDDGMAEHADKAADPQLWAAGRATRFLPGHRPGPTPSTGMDPGRAPQ